MTASASKWVYLFGDGKADGTADMKDLLGGKGANLAEMANLGLPVPPGFTITTEVCTAYYKAGTPLPAGLDAQVESRARPHSAKSSAPRSATRPIRCWSPCARARAPPCPA